MLGVVPSEMPSKWNYEALKAQAIAARSYAIANRGKEPQEAMTSKILRKTRPTAVHLQKQLPLTVLLWKQKESLSLTTERLFLLTIQPLQADIPLMPVLYGTKIYPT